MLIEFSRWNCAASQLTASTDSHIGINMSQRRTITLAHYRACSERLQLLQCDWMRAAWDRWILLTSLAVSGLTANRSIMSVRPQMTLIYNMWLVTGSGGRPGLYYTHCGVICSAHFHIMRTPCRAPKSPRVASQQVLHLQSTQTGNWISQCLTYSYTAHFCDCSA